MKYLYFISIVLFGCIAFSGCRSISPPGIVYTHKTLPLDVNLSRTPAGTFGSEKDVKHIQLRYVNVKISWDSNAIGDIAAKNGLDIVYYADIETFSILGVWNQYTVHVYGNGSAKTVSAD